MRNTVLIYRSVLLPHSETFIREQVLAYKTWRPLLIGRRKVGELPLDGIEVCTLEPARRTFLSRVRSRLWRQLGWAPRLAMLRRESPRLLHAHFGPDALEAAPIAQALHIPMLVTLHGFDVNVDRAWWESGRGGRWMINYPRRLLALAQRPDVRFISVSEALRQRAVAFGIPADKISVHYIGIDTTKFAPAGRPIAEREPRVLFVGRLVEKKGCRYLIEAMAEVQRRVAAARLVIIGDGPLRTELEQLARDFGVNAEFRGTQPAAEVKRELDLARAFCLPSVIAESGDAEGLPIVVLEAQAAGVAVATSARGREEAVADGLTGVTFEERDVASLAVKLQELLSDDGVLPSMTAGPRFIAQKFDLHRCTEGLEEFYDRVAGQTAAQAANERDHRSPLLVTR